ncbi:fimbria/pilus periplasmic chaperone [Vibrio kyushuensis]|uniref:fimbria/pilus periplasmic chaperone n=1 Tax=Vibrio kyushuensis TaxID=2910249 RepID=UPI003D09B0C9
MKVLFLFLLLMTPQLVLAFQVEPMVQKFESTGNLAQAGFRIENTSDKPLALETLAQRRHVTFGDNEALEVAERDFIIMPPQAFIEPGQFQFFRVRYLGSEPINQSISYRIVFKQLPLQYENKESGLELLFNFATLAFVSPNGAQPLLIAGIDEDILSIKNIGNGLADFYGSTINFVNNNSNKILSWEDVGNYSTTNYLIPGQEVQIPIQDDWNIQQLEITSVKVILP